MKPEEFQELTIALSTVMMSDPLLALCNAVAWLDPLADEALHQTFAEAASGAYYGDFDDWTNISTAWDISRNCFPEVYAETTIGLRSGLHEHTLAEEVCDGINRHLVGPELTYLEQIHWGLPFSGEGIDITMEGFREHPDYDALRQVYGLLGIDVERYERLSFDDEYRHCVTVAEVLSASLEQQTQPHYLQVGRLLDWMFSMSGNSVVDYSNDDMYDMNMEPLPWRPYELEFNNYMHAEAAELLKDAEAGLSFLLSSDELQTILRTHVQEVSRVMRKVKRHDEQRNAERLIQRLRWPEYPEQPDEHETADDTQDFSVWRADAA